MLGLSAREALFVLTCACFSGFACPSLAADDSPTPELMELRDLDVTAWDCLNRAAGDANTPDGVDRNRLKNRGPIDLPATNPAFDSASFLKQVAAYDEEIAVKRRSELNPAQKERLATFEKQIVSVTGWIVLSYVGAPESTNCGDPVLVDWHLELFEKPSDHPPTVGDPTPIVCEITPRTERNIYRDNIRVQAISGFFRLFHGLSYQSTGHKAQKVRVTGFLLWDDEHNGKADIGEKIEDAAPNKYHHPWRSTAWEIHPVLKVEVVCTPPERP